ncbi:MAG: hypothetical protein NTZ37_05060 [Methanoregula sp.]|nr:hypothetical protein [Methanoregula sp.]
MNFTEEQDFLIKGCFDFILGMFLFGDVPYRCLQDLLLLPFEPRQEDCCRKLLAIQAFMGPFEVMEPFLDRLFNHFLCLLTGRSSIRLAFR